MGGLITYHRTDSTTLSDKALNESARVIREMFGGEHLRQSAPLPDAREKCPGSARGDSPHGSPLAPSQLEGAGLDGLRLYELIWKRTMASQMVDARCAAHVAGDFSTGPQWRDRGADRQRQGH